MATREKRNNYIISNFYSLISHNQTTSEHASRVGFLVGWCEAWGAQFDIHDVKRRMKLLIDLTCI